MRRNGWVSMRSLAVMGALLAFGVTASAQADPPGRVGRLSLVQGEVELRNAETGAVEAAHVNWPVSNRAVLVTGSDGRAEVRVGSTSIRLGAGSELEFAQLDDERIRIEVLAGSVGLRVRNREKLDEIEIDVPQGHIRLEDVGRYRIDVDPGRDSSAVTAHEGVARVQFAGNSLAVRAGRRAEAVGPGGQSMQVSPASRDGFDDWNLARDRIEEASQSARYVSPEMTGYEELDRYGEWRQAPDYGPIWVPHATAVSVGWAPYRSGRWVWIDPWGWTWIDDAPWGFAPFHYGRWVYIGGSWAWAPGVRVARPVYAPALVGWIGQPGARVSVGVGPAIGWFPLAPREVYHPAYPCSPIYVRSVNVTHVHEIPRPHAGHPHGSPGRPYYRNVELPHAVTMVPERVVTRGQPVAPAIVPFKDAAAVRSLPVVERASALAPERPVFDPHARRGVPRYSVPDGQGGLPRPHRMPLDASPAHRALPAPGTPGHPPLPAPGTSAHAAPAPHAPAAPQPMPARRQHGQPAAPPAPGPGAHAAPVPHAPPGVQSMQPPGGVVPGSPAGARPLSGTPSDSMRRDLHREHEHNASRRAVAPVMPAQPLVAPVPQPVPPAAAAVHPRPPPREPRPLEHAPVRVPQPPQMSAPAAPPAATTREAHRPPPVHREQRVEHPRPGVGAPALPARAAPMSAAPPPPSPQQRERQSPGPGGRRGHEPLGR